MKKDEMQFHPIADLFPMMNADEAEVLCLDIATNGQHEPILTATDPADGKVKIVDGRNRYRACLSANIEPQFRMWDGEGSLQDLVVSLNLKRRHLSESQRTMVAAKLAKMERGRPSEKNTEISVNMTQTNAAKLLNVSVDSIQFAKKVQEKGIPELIQEVETGERSVSNAAAIASLSPMKQKRLIKAGRKSGRKLIQSRIAQSLKHTEKGVAGCAHCNPEFKWTDVALSAFAQKLAFRARQAGGSAARYAPVFESIAEEIEELNLSEKTQELYELILQAIDAGVTEEGDEGIRERSDLQRVTKIPWPEFNNVIAVMVDTRMIEPVQQGGKTEMARGARKTLFKRCEKPDLGLTYEMDEGLTEKEVYLERW